MSARPALVPRPAAAAAPTVSVCIPVWNRERELAEALASVQAQDFTDFEIVVLDDGSSDGSRAVAERAAERDPRIRVAANAGKLGIPAARNRCLELARGRYLAWLDSDDLMSPHRLARQVACLDREPALATVGGWVRSFDNNPRGAGRLLLKPLVHAQLAAWLLFRCCHANTTVMGRRALLLHHGYRSEFPVSEDYDLSVRLVAGHRVANLPAVLGRQRQHAGRTTASSGDRNEATKSRLVAAQLDRLGLAASAEDLAFHYRLTRLGRADVAMPDFADRCADWLRRITDANRRSAVHEPAVLADVLQLIRTQVGLKLVRVHGPARGLAVGRRLGGDGSLLRLLAGNLPAAWRGA